MATPSKPVRIIPPPNLDVEAVVREMLDIRLSPDEVERKRLAIFKHQSQKDRALFPGPSDGREFWQRAEQRNQSTAEVFDKLGLPEYQAIEAFVRRRDEQ